MICYRFDTEAQWRTLALANGLASIVDGVFTLRVDHGIAIVDIGVIYNDDATFGANGDVITPPTAKPGHHVNMVHPAPPDALDPYLVVVSTAYNRFSAGPDQAPDDATLDEILAP